MSAATTDARRDGPITYARVLGIAVPVVLSNATVPLQGAIDTAIIGNLGETAFLAAVTLGATVINLILNSFNFLQIGVSGLSAQALGEGNPGRVMNTLVRALLIALAIALALNLLSPLVAWGGLALFAGSAEAEALAATYIQIRLLGAPAELAGYAVIGWFTGQELTRRLFEIQIVTSGVNIAMNLFFVFGLGWGVEGVAAGTAIGAYAGLAFGLWRVRQRMQRLVPEGYRPERARILDPAELAQVVALNRDILLRTLLLTAAFAYLSVLGSMQGDVVLAANGVLLQILYVSAYGLDGFAMAAETLVGQKIGARDRRGLRRAVVVTTVTAVGLAALVSALATLFSDPIIALFTNVPEIRAAAAAHAIWATMIPLVGVMAFQMDGIFVGAADGRAMRNAMLISSGVFFPLGWALSDWLGNHGIWLAVWIWMILRAVTLLIRYPAVEARLEASGPARGQRASNGSFS